MSATATIPLEALTFSISIDRDARAVYRFISDPQNLPKWASAFSRSVLPNGADWVMQTRKGSRMVLFHPAKSSDVRSHQVYSTPVIEHYIPVRVLASSSGSDVLLVLFHRPDITGEASQGEIFSATDALIKLKRQLEW
jgi:hypothetical protein